MYADEDYEQGRSTQVKDTVLLRMYLFVVVVKQCLRLSLKKFLFLEINCFVTVSAMETMLVL